MSKIFLIRHFEPEYRSRKAIVKVDPGSLKELRGYLTSARLRKVYVSPTKRTTCTARLLFPKNKIFVDNNLRGKGKRELLLHFKSRVDKTLRKAVKERTSAIIAHDTTLNQVLASLYKVPYRKVNIIFPFGEPLLLKIGETGIIYFCKRIVV